VARLIINPNAANRRELTLSRDEILTIGRDPSNDLVLPDSMVSRRHAVIERRGKQYFLRDCNSANGSVVNGDRVSERGLRDGDLVAIGSMRLLFREEAADPGAKVVRHPSAVPMSCPHCGAEYRRGDLFCRDCGARVPRPSGPPRAVCSSCGTAVPLPARFCSACGESLGSAAGEGEAAGKDAGEAGGRPHGRPSAARGGSEETPSLGRLGGAAAPAPALVPEPTAERPRRAPTARADRAKEPVPPRSVPPRVPPSLRPPRPARPEGLSRRLVAGLIDSVFVVSGQAVMLVPVAYYWWSREPPQVPGEVPFLPIVTTVTLVVLAGLAGALYHVYFWGVRGATPGKELLDLRVETEGGSSPIGLGRAAVRLLGYLLSAASLGVGFLMIALGDGGLHDRVAGTRVVRRSRP
jgi:uncharacterized RDD family membrane protein YckC